MPYLDIVFTFITLCVCAYTDAKKRKIYNLFTLPLIPIGVFNTIFLYGLEKGLIQCAWLLPAFLICFVLYKTHQIGGGDAKLILGIGALMGLEYTLILLFISFLLGWIYAAVQFIQQKRLKAENLKDSQRIMIPLGSIMLGAFGILEGIQLYMGFM